MNYQISYFPPCGADTIVRCLVSLHMAREGHVPVWERIYPTDCEAFPSAIECTFDNVHHVEYV